MTEKDRPLGLPHFGKGHPLGPWLFNQNGKYAAAVDKTVSGKCLKIIVYDCIEKAAFDYLAENPHCITPYYFYWYDELLFLVVLRNLDQQPFLFCLELNHKERNARLVTKRKLQTELAVEHPYFTAFSTEFVLPLNLMTLDNTEYITIFEKSEQSLMLIPANPFCDLSLKQFLIAYKFEEQYEELNGFVFENSHLPYVIGCNGSTIKLLNTKKDEEISPEHHGYTFDLKTCLHIDLTKLEDIYGKEVDHQQLILEQDSNASSKSPMLIGKKLFLGYLIPIFGLGNIQIHFTDRGRKDTTTARDCNHLSSAMHPTGQVVHLDYKIKNTEHTDRLFMRSEKKVKDYVPTLKNMIKMKLLCDKDFKIKGEKYEDIIDRFL